MNATDKNKLIDRIRTLDGLTDDERSALLGLLRESKTYGLVWEDKPEEIEKRLATELPVLKEVKSKAIISDNADAPNHILIEGDNLEALTTLVYTHEGKIDVIYIDPPYNTGNKDFVYNDSFVDSEDSYRHSKWLSFMSKRLRIAKKLLSDRGVIFISIDFHELPNLISLGNEIFGESNFLANIAVKGNPRGRQSSSYFAQVDDSLVVYRKSPATVLQGFQISDESQKKRFNKVDDLGNPYEEWELRKRGADSRRIDSPNLWFPIYFDKSTHVLSTNPIGTDDIIITPKLSTGEDGRWRWSRDKVEKDKKSLYVRATRSGYNVFERKYPETKSRQLAPTIWDYAEVNTELGTKLLKDILGNDVPFDYPKPIGLIQLILQLYINNHCTILDFFAGSGTTLHATMKLNAEDGGKRTCILCTNNENGICENVTYERNKRVIHGYTKPNGEAVEGLHDNNLRYYRTDFVGRRRTPQNMRRLMLLASDMLCIKENLYTEYNDFGNLKTLENGFRYFKKDDKQMLIVYNEEAIYTLVDEISDMEVENPIIIYVFSPSNDPWSAEFDEVGEKVRLTALPAAIYNAYKRVLPKPKDTLVKEEQPQPEENIGGLFNMEGGDQ